jgi:uncharacterized protein
MISFRKLCLATATFVALAITVSGSVAAASFNCRYAKLPTEVSICQNEDLSAFDEEMATYYSYLTSALRGSALRNLKSAQNRFIARRNACGYNAGCISTRYRARIEALCNTPGNHELECS